MTKAEQIEKLRLEYQLYNQHKMYSLRDVLFFIEDSQDYFDEVLSSSQWNRNIDKLKRVGSKVLGEKCYAHGYMSTSDYDIDIGLLQLEETICMGSNLFFQRLFDAVNDDNVEQVSLLAQFTQDKCEEDIARIENYRMAAKENNGYGINTLFEEPLNFVSFSEFFDEVVTSATHVEVPKYTRKSTNK